MKRYTSLSECYEDGQPASRYYSQWPGAVPKVGNVYVTHPGTWQEVRYRVVYVGEGVAVGIALGSPLMGMRNKGDAALFHADGIRAGWRYRDDRPGYRLQPEEGADE